MGTTSDLAAFALRQFVVDGVQASGGNDPDKTAIFGAFADADTRLGALETSQTANALAYAKWIQLAAIGGTVPGQKAEVYSDNGSHTDPVNGATVANNGVYAWVAGTGGGWQWLSSNSLTTKADLASPSFTGVPRAPTAAFGVKTTQLTTTAFVQAALAPYMDVFSLSGAASNDGQAYTAAADPSLVAYVASAFLFVFTPSMTNTGPVTLAVNGLAALPVVDARGVTLPAGVLKGSAPLLLRLVGTTQLRVVGLDLSAANSNVYFQSSGSTSLDGLSYAVTGPATVTGYVAGALFTFTPDTTNVAGGAQLNVNSIGAMPMVNAAGLPLPAGAVVAGTTYIVEVLAATFRVLGSDKAPLASPVFTGTPTAPTAAAGTSTTQIATTAFASGAVSALATLIGQTFAPLASPTLTGVPKAPTADPGTNTNQIATTAFVENELASATAVKSLLQITGAASADGLTYTGTSVAKAYATNVMFLLTVPVTNTGAVKLDLGFGGSANPRYLRDAAGAEIPAGLLVAGNTYLLISTGSGFTAINIEKSRTLYDLAVLDKLALFSSYAASLINGRLTFTSTAGNVPLAFDAAKVSFLDGGWSYETFNAQGSTYLAAFTAPGVDVNRRYRVIGIKPDLTLGLTRDYEQHIADGHVLSFGAQTGTILDANGRIIFAPLADGTCFLQLSARALDFLSADLSPSPTTIRGVANAFATQRQPGTIVQFLANLEAPPPANSLVTMPYIQRTDIVSTTAMRATRAPIRYRAWTGNSVSVGSQSGDGGKATTTTPPAAVKNSGFMFNPGTLGSGTRGMGTVAFGTLGFPANSLTDFVPAYEQNYAGTQLGETSVTSFLAMMTTLRDRAGLPWEVNVGRTHGAAGNPIAQVLPGSQPFTNGLAECKIGVTISASFSRPMTASIIYVGGHQDRSGINTTLSASANAGDTVLTLAAVIGGYKGMLAIGSGITAGTTITDVNTANKTVTLSAGLGASMASGASFVAQVNPAGYQASLSTLAAGYATQWQAATGQPTAPVLWIDQLDGFCTSNPTPADGAKLSPVIAFAQLAWVRANPALGRIVMPMYLCLHDTVAATPNQNDGDHLAPLKGYGIRGEYEAKAQFTEETTGKRWSALGENITVNRVGATISIQFFRDTAKTVPWDGLNFDTTTFAATLGTCEAVPDGNFGFVHDGAAINGVAIATSSAAAAVGLANDQVNVTLASAVAGNLSYAAYGPGSKTHADAWGNLADSDATLSRLFPGLALKNLCVVMKMAVA